MIYMNTNNEMIMSKKLEFYEKNNLIVHVDCFNNRFYNGKIIELNVKKGLFVLEDKKLGPIPILFEEIRKVEPYDSKGNKGVKKW